MQEGKAEGRMGLRRFRRIRERSEDAQAVCLRRDSEAGSGGQIRGIGASSRACDT